ncbi:histidine kinase [Blautia schinkii]|nr:histidine kinase [Blautia schinkii]
MMNTHSIRNTHFKTKLFISISILLTTLALLVSTIFTYHSMRSTVENENLSSNGLLERISMQVGTLYEQMNIAATSITKNSTMKNIVIDLNTMDYSETVEYMSMLEQERTIQKLLGNMMFSPIISNVILYSCNPQYFYYSGTYLNDAEHIQKVLRDDNSEELFSNTSVIFRPPGQNPWLTSKQTVLSVLRNFSDNSTTENTVVSIQVPYRELDEICTQKSFAGEKEILLLDKEGNIVYPENPQYSLFKKQNYDTILKEISDGQNSKYTYPYAYFSSFNEDIGFRTVLLSNNRTVHKQIYTYIISTVLVVLCALLLTLLIVFRILSAVTKPLNQLIESVDKLSADSDAKLSIPKDSLDEFKILRSSLDQMVSSLKTSLKENYELQIRESNASLAALQAQIDPHFLYNALNSISAASEIYGSEMTTLMCQEFSSMMRYITSSKQTVTLIEELRHTENYLNFMKLSNEDNFSYSIQTDPELYSLTVPKMCIQPLVENSFKHGFKSTLPPWEISICCNMQDVQSPHINGWEITIRDNGCGFEEETIRAITEMPLTFHAQEINGLGLNNTFSRMAILYKGNFQYTIENLSPGSKITLKGVLTDDNDTCSRGSDINSEGYLQKN